MTSTKSPAPTRPMAKLEIENPLDVITHQILRVPLEKKPYGPPLGMNLRNTANGYVQVDVIPGSLAALAGIRSKDYIMSVNRSLVGDSKELSMFVSATIGSLVLVVARKRSMPLDLSHLKLPDGHIRKPSCKYFLTRIRGTTYADFGIQLMIVDNKVRVKFVANDMPGHICGFKVGDCILSIGEYSIRNVQDFEKTLDAASAEGIPADVLIERPSDDSEFQIIPEKCENVADPSAGVEPCPIDVQLIVDKIREQVVNKIGNIAGDDSNPKKPKFGNVRVDMNVSIAPLVKEKELDKKTPKSDEK